MPCYIATYGSEDLNRDPDHTEIMENGCVFTTTEGSDIQRYYFRREDETSLQFEVPATALDKDGKLVLPRWHGPKGPVELIRLTITVLIQRNEYNDGSMLKRIDNVDILDIQPLDFEVNWWLAPSKPESLQPVPTTIATTNPTDTTTP